jgi:hypothetical protein
LRLALHLALQKRVIPAALVVSPLFTSIFGWPGQPGKIRVGLTQQRNIHVPCVGRPLPLFAKLNRQLSLMMLPLDPAAGRRPFSPHRFLAAVEQVTGRQTASCRLKAITRESNPSFCALCARTRMETWCHPDSVLGSGWKREKLGGHESPPASLPRLTPALFQSVRGGSCLSA